MKTRCITVYDYDNKPVTVELPEKKIVFIFVNVISGDETGWVIFEDSSSIRFDASDCRIQSFYDGSYIVLEPDIEDWVKYKPPGNETCAYARQEAFWEKAHKHKEANDEQVRCNDSHFDDRVRLAAGPDADLEYSADFLEGIKVVLYMLSTEPAVPHEMTAREYLETEARMCKYYGIPCAFDVSGMTVDKAIEMVEKFAQEHPERSEK